MNKTNFLGAILFLVLPLVAEEPVISAAQVSENTSAEESKPDVSLVLSDNSTLKGHLRDERLVGVSDVFGTLRIPMAEVASWAAEKEGFIRVVTRGSDTVRIKPEAKELSVETLLGVLAVPLANIRKATVSAPVSNEGLIYYCTFDSEDAIRHPAVGPEGKFFAGDFVPGKVENALYLPAGKTAAEFSFPLGLMKTQGCIEFWACIPGVTRDSRFPDGGSPQFFALQVGQYVNTFIKYTSNDGNGAGGLHVGLPGPINLSTNPRWSTSACYSDVLEDPAAWHHYAMVWSDQGLEEASAMLGRQVVLACYIDGRLVKPVYGFNGIDRGELLHELTNQNITLFFPLVPGKQTPEQSRIPFLIDDFKIWSVPKCPEVSL